MKSYQLLVFAHKGTSNMTNNERNCEKITKKWLDIWLKENLFVLLCSHDIHSLKKTI